MRRHDTYSSKFEMRVLICHLVHLYYHHYNHLLKEVSLVILSCCVVVFCSILMVKHEWDRDERSFICVAATFLTLKKNPHD